MLCGSQVGRAGLSWVPTGGTSEGQTGEGDGGRGQGLGVQLAVQGGSATYRW